MEYFNKEIENTKYNQMENLKLNNHNYCFTSKKSIVGLNSTMKGQERISEMKVRTVKKFPI